MVKWYQRFAMMKGSPMFDAGAQTARSIIDEGETSKNSIQYTKRNERKCLLALYRPDGQWDGCDRCRYEYVNNDVTGKNANELFEKQPIRMYNHVYLSLQSNSDIQTDPEVPKVEPKPFWQQRSERWQSYKVEIGWSYPVRLFWDFHIQITILEIFSTWRTRTY